MALKRVEGGQQDRQARGCLGLALRGGSNGEVKVREKGGENGRCLCVGVEDDRQPKGGLVHWAAFRKRLGWVVERLGLFTFDCKQIMPSRRRNPFAELPWRSSTVKKGCVQRTQGTDERNWMIMLLSASDFWAPDSEDSEEKRYRFQ